MRPRHALLVGALAVAALVGSARPAAADPARPGNVRSTVTAVEPPAPLTARVVGGDAFLELRVSPGHEAIVLDYEGHPYLRFAHESGVFENRRSKAAYLNRDRFATAALPDGLDPAAAPDWALVATGRTHAWHDHRTHWMGRARSPEQAWRVDLVVDGRATAVVGRFGPLDAPPAWPWWIGAALSMGLVVVVTRRSAPRAAAVALVAVPLAAPVSIALARLPAGSRTAGLLLGVAAALALASLVVLREPSVAWALCGGAGAALAAWAVRRVDVFGHAVLVTDLPAWFDRSATAAALGAGTGLVLSAASALRVAPSRPPRASPSDGAVT